MWFYAGFIGLVVVILALDLGVFHRKAHVVGMREALAWSTVWTTCALLFSVFVYFAYSRHWLGLGMNVPVLGHPELTETVPGLTAAKQYLTGYVVELSLSVDNIFVIALLFRFFAVPEKYQHRVLFWGILGALIMRGAMIGVGAALIARFSWIIYVFGGFLILTAVKMALAKNEEIDPNRNVVARLVRKFIPISEEFDGQRFFTRIGGRTVATPLLLTLVLVEFTDLIFAVDSIPAIFAITADPFIVLTSNVFAILGLRSMYFCLSGLINKFRYLKVSLIGILFFVGVKMCLVHTPFKIDTTVSLFVILGMLGAGIVGSILRPISPQAERNLPGPAGILGSKARDEQPAPAAARD
ncbi:MAG: TerC family protein [Phycisphaerales bacterium]|nr:TerC family protein [Phycisphaerales bacterium]